MGGIAVLSILFSSELNIVYNLIWTQGLRRGGGQRFAEQRSLTEYSPPPIAGPTIIPTPVNNSR